mgnify:CR=1 FL=1
MKLKFRRETEILEKKIQILVRNRNFGKIPILLRNRNFEKNPNFTKKSKFRSL